MALGWTKYQICIAVLMVTTGSINTLAAKWANLIPSLNSIGEVVPFNHPFLQSTAMFLGELMCMAAFFFQIYCLRRRTSPQEYIPILDLPGEEKKPFTNKKFYLLMPPAVCDMTATSIMYVALTLTSASSFQMLRGAVIIFTGINSMIFLKRKLEWFRWLGIVVIIAGLVLVGAADIIQTSGPAECVAGDATASNATAFNATAATPTCVPAQTGPKSEIVGDLLVVGSQVIVSIQMVYEEKVLSRYEIAPLLAVGWEGFFGFVFMCLLLVVFAYVDVGSPMWGNSPSPPWMLEDAIDGLVQIGNSGLLLFALLLLVVSIAFFNFAGISVTKELNATTRMVLDTVRTLVIWVFSLALGWQSFQFLQPIGFVVLVAGMSLYYDIIIMPAFRKLLPEKYV